MVRIVLLLVLTGSLYTAQPELRGGGGGRQSTTSRRLSIDVLDLRPRIPQNIDIADPRTGQRSCWERLMDTVSGWCSSRHSRRPVSPETRVTPTVLAPTRLHRTDSIYPGRGQKDMGE